MTISIHHNLGWIRKFDRRRLADSLEDWRLFTYYRYSFFQRYSRMFDKIQRREKEDTEKEKLFVQIQNLGPKDVFVCTIILVLIFINLLLYHKTMKYQWWSLTIICHYMSDELKIKGQSLFYEWSAAEQVKRLNISSTSEIKDSPIFDL